MLSPLVHVLLGVQRVSTGSPSRAAACTPAWRRWEWRPALLPVLLVLGNDGTDWGGRCFSAAVGTWTWSGEENSSEPESAFLPAAVWGKGGSDVVVGLVWFFFFFKGENWEGRNLLWSQSKLQPKHPYTILPS